MREIVVVATVFLAVLLFFIWWDERRARRRWLERRDWRGSNLRDTNKNRAFPRKKYEYPSKTEK